MFLIEIHVMFLDHYPLLLSKKINSQIMRLLKEACNGKKISYRGNTQTV
jgi:hypothetical protein